MFMDLDQKPNPILSRTDLLTMSGNSRAGRSYMRKPFTLKHLSASHSIVWQMLGLGQRLPMKQTLASWLQLAVQPVLRTQWLRFLRDFTDEQTLAPPHDDLLRRPISSFLVKRMSMQARLQLILDHFDVAGDTMSCHHLQKLWLGEAVNIGSVAGVQDSYCIKLVLSDRCGAGQSGVFSLRLIRERDRQLLCTASFTFVRCTGGRYSLVIGEMRGPDDAQAQQAIADTTSCLGGLHPKDALLLMLKGIVLRSSIPYLMVVSDKKHIGTKRIGRKRGNIREALDDYWMECGAVAFPTFGYRIPVCPGVAIETYSRREESKLAFWKLATSLHDGF